MCTVASLLAFSTVLPAIDRMCSKSILTEPKEVISDRLINKKFSPLARSQNETAPSKPGPSGSEIP